MKAVTRVVGLAILCGGAAVAQQNVCNDYPADCSPVISQFWLFHDCFDAQNHEQNLTCCNRKEYRYKCEGDTNWRYIVHNYPEEESLCPGNPPEPGQPIMCISYDEASPGGGS